MLREMLSRGYGNSTGKRFRGWPEGRGSEHGEGEIIKTDILEKPGDWQPMEREETQIRGF